MGWCVRRWHQYGTSRRRCLCFCNKYYAYFSGIFYGGIYCGQFGLQPILQSICRRCISKYRVLNQWRNLVEYARKSCWYGCRGLHMVCGQSHFCVYIAGCYDGPAQLSPALELCIYRGHVVGYRQYHSYRAVPGKCFCFLEPGSYPLYRCRSYHTLQWQHYIGRSICRSYHNLTTGGANVHCYCYVGWMYE